ncbi:MAG: 3-phosphoglycerate dehydrogenase [Lachnospiraceae bacterium]|nr:3-phosphoglycerate dehydrogenase [Lachnospiraceae bacterium]
MNKICLMNAISKKGTAKFGADYEMTEELGGASAIMVRSAVLHDTEFPDSLLAIARAGAGVNNIPLDRCADTGIMVFNTPGANANAVKELVLAGMFLACRDIVGGIAWAKANKDEPDVAKKAEKEKKKFAGTEIFGKTLGVIGCGAIGYKVAKACEALGMDILGYDPYLELEDIPMTKDINDIYAKSDFITIHVPVLPSTKGMINQEAFAKMKDGVVFLNFARDTLVNEEDMKAALASGKVRRYVCDFATPGTLNMDGTIITPHLGASTEESEENCAVMAAEELMDYIEKGNVRNAVTYPRLSKELPGKAARYTVMFKGELPKEAGEVLGDDIVCAVRGDYGYAIADTDAAVPEEALAKIPAIKVRKVF